MTKEKLRQVRGKLSQTKFGEYVGFCQKSISFFETGRAKMSNEIILAVEKFERLRKAKTKKD